MSSDFREKQSTIMVDGESAATPGRRLPPRTRSTFLTRTASDTAAQLEQSSPVAPSAVQRLRSAQHSLDVNKPYQGVNAPRSTPYHQPTLLKGLKSYDADGNASPLLRRSSSGKRKTVSGYGSFAAHTSQHGEAKDSPGKADGPRPGALPRPIGGHSKLSTFSGVFVPTSLNVLSILMFLRFGFILGQSGFLGMMGMLIVSYLINLITTLSLSAIATNGTVRGGGPYYLISRSLGPEFGGSIACVFYLGSLLNTSMNVVGLIDCLKQNFGSLSGNWAQWLPEGFWWEYLWGTAILLLCTGICLAGSGVFARCSNGLLALLLLATFSIPFSTLVVQPFRNAKMGINYTGLCAQTFKGNLQPSFTRRAAGSQLRGKENFQDLLGILFPATGGIFAGASMSGDLKHPSKAIPKGTLSGLALTFSAYTIVIVAMAASISRETFLQDLNIIQNVNVSGTLILLGEFATSFFSALMGVIGSAKLLQALARDNLLPGFSVFGQGTQTNDEPTYAILITYVIAQVAMLSDINQLASFVTMTYLMTFLVTNMATFCLKVSSAPNFRPSFRYFNWWTAGFGTLISGATMFFVDGGYATGCVGISVIIFLIIHYCSPPKSWGDVSQNLIYHQVRKYLLRLRQEHVKFWRPQILLFINDPRHQYELIQFCNSLKKGALFILGHVIISDDFGVAVPEARRQQANWTKYIEFSKIKAFVNIAISPGIEWGTRNIVLGAGLGGMRPNIVVMGFYNLEKFRKTKSLRDVLTLNPPQARASAGDIASESADRSARQTNNNAVKPNTLLPTDACRIEDDVSPTSYVTILEDMLLRLQINVAIAKGFQNLEFPHLRYGNTKKYIDLWPIQMSAEIASEGGEKKQNVLTTNFDTYTLILQLGCILDTVPSWKRAYKLRVAVFVEYESDVEEERGRVKTLLTKLRIEAEVLVFWLASGRVKTYQVIVNGGLASEDEDIGNEIDGILGQEDWWQDIQKRRRRRRRLTPTEELHEYQRTLNVIPTWPTSSFQSGRQESNLERFEGLKKFLRGVKRRPSSGELESFGVRLNMRTHKLHDELVHRHATHASASEDSESDGDEASSIEEDNDTSSQGRASAASENDIDDLEFADDGRTARSTSPAKLDRRRSDGEPVKNTLAPNFSAYGRTKFANSSGASGSKRKLLVGPRAKWRSSAAKFFSNHVPGARTAEPGPSVNFTESSSLPTPIQHSSIYHRQPSFESAQASGFPIQQSAPFSFNDLPCRAQHLILNELMQQHSAETAVLFTTLPSPVENTCQSEQESLSYLSDLEVLCRGLPPVLLVHSNSMTVTMNL